MKEETLSKRSRQEIAWKILIWALGAATSALAMFTKHVFMEIKDVDRRVTIIESSRCTASVCGDIRSTLVAIQSEITHLSKDSPPRWLIDKIDNLQGRIDRIESAKRGSASLKE